MTTYQFFTLLIPILSATIVGVLTYLFALKSKRIDLLYQNKIPAFKELALKLTEYKNFCLGRVAYLQGNEYSPFWEEGSGTLHHRTEIANVAAHNAIFLTDHSRKLLYKMLAEMGLSCNIEVALILDPDLTIDSKVYEVKANTVDMIIESLYKELNLE